MKKRLFSTLTAGLVAGIAIVGCDKKPDAAPSTDNSTPAKPAEPGKPSEPSKPADPAKPTASTPAAPSAPTAPAADPAQTARAYGFVARLPKDVEAFSASYRLHDLWSSLANSKWTATLLSIPQLAEEQGFKQMQEQWNSPQGQQVRDVAAAVLGEEVIIGMPAGFSSKMKPWMSLLEVYNKALYSNALMGGLMGGNGPDPAQMQKMFKNMAPDLIPAAAACDMPPMLFAFKAAKAKEIIQQGSEQLLGMVGTVFPPSIEKVAYKVDGKYDFNGILVDAKKLIVDFQAAQLELQLKEILGDEKKAKEAIAGIVNKKFEFSWGWVDEYLVVSIGADHAHVKFAASPADSALANPEVAGLAGQFAAKKPMSLAYTSKATFDSFNTKLEFAGMFKSVAEQLDGILKAEHIEAMVSDVKKLEARAQALFTTTYDSQIAIGWWENGLKSEIFGGARDSMTDSSKPLSLANLATPASFLFFNGRSNGANSKAVSDFIEDSAGTVWGWYEKYGRTMVPESERQGAAMVEATAVPLLKEFWKGLRLLDKALGDESAFIFDTVGKVPTTIPDAPPFLKDGKMPRLAVVAELTDRAALGESWAVFNSIIKQISALADGLPPIEPKMKKEGEYELHYLELPIPTEDFLPNVSISKDRWIISTSPSLSLELLAKPANTTGPAMGGHVLVQFSALYDHVDAWLKVLDKNATTIFQGDKASEYQAARPTIDTVLKLARSIEGVEAKISQEGGKTHNSIHLKLQDVK